MLKALRWIVQGILAMLLLVAVLWAVSRLWPQSRAQREAVALLEREPVLQGKNAFAAMWLLGYDDIAEADYAALLEGDVAKHRQSLDALAHGELPTVSSFASVAAGRYTPVPTVEQWCNWREPGCLEKVRHDPARVALELEGQQALLQRISALSQYGHYRNAFPPDPAMLMPPFQLLARALPAHALAHVQGRSGAALQGICQDTQTARMLISHSDSLVSAMIGVAMVEGNAVLLAEVLAELPPDYPLPDNCQPAFAPPAATELTVCHGMRGEFALSSAAITASSGWPQSLLLDRKKTRGRVAGAIGWSCNEATLQAIARDQPARPEKPPHSLWQLECVANPIGCVLADIAAPAYDDYQLSLQDAGAQLRLVAALLWLREQVPGSSPGSALPQLPAALAQGPRTISVSADGRYLQLERYRTRQGAALSLRLPEAGAEL